MSAEVSPECIFDTNGSIVVDEGAMKFIDGIEINKVQTTQPGFPLGITVTIHPSRYLSRAPILSGIQNVLSYTVERGPKFDWRYTNLNGTIPLFRSFRLEILY